MVMIRFTQAAKLYGWDTDHQDSSSRAVDDAREWCGFHRCDGRVNDSHSKRISRVRHVKDVGAKLCYVRNGDVVLMLMCKA